MNTAAPPDSRPPRPIDRTAVAIAVVLAAVIVAALYFTYTFIKQERQRDLQAWQTRLGIVADGRAAAVTEWVDDNFAVLRGLAENASLQLYMTELTLSQRGKGAAPDESAQAGYLRNLLVDTANRGGFTPPTRGWEVPANVERVGVAGISLADATGQAIVSTPGMPPLTGRIRSAIAKALGGEPALIDIYMGATNLPTIGFVLPIFAVQDPSKGTEGIGAVVGIRTIGNALSSRLHQPGDTAKTAETYLVRPTATTVEYISPLADGTAALKKALALDTPDLAAAFALAKPGGFGIKRDYRGTDVLVTSRPIAGTPWTLVRKIDREEALSQADRRRTTLLIVFVLVIIGVSGIIVAVWRHGGLLRASETAEKYRIAAERFEHLSAFLRVVADSQPTAIAAVDAAGKYTFANLRAAEQAGSVPDDMLGKTPGSVLGAARAEAYARLNRQVLAQNQPVSHVHVFHEDDEERVVRSSHIPLPGDHGVPPGVLMVIDDVTELTQERRRREHMLRQLVDTLVSVVDRRDPYSAHHSRRVAEVSRCIAREMGLPDAKIETVDIAGSLMNLGKIFVPTELLTKTENLTDEERALLADSYRISGDLLEGVSFDGPVVETIREMNETWDGSGPLGIKEEAILRTARVLAVANAFVGMISPLAYREAMTFKEVGAALVEEAGTRFDRKSVSALINYLENRGGAEAWAHFREPPAEGSD